MNIGRENSYLFCGLEKNTSSKFSYFKDFIACGKIDVPNFKDEASTIISTKSNVEIENTRLLEKDIEIEKYSQIYICKLIIVELKITLQIKYICGYNKKSVFVDYVSFYKNIYITVPKEVEGFSPDDLIRKSSYAVNTHIEDSRGEILDSNHIKYSLVGFVNIDFITKNKTNLKYIY